MTSQMFLIVISAVQWFAIYANPFFQGISFQRGFEINFKPLEKHPFEFIRESWSPFGVFGKKFSIQKRSLDDIAPLPPRRFPRPAAPVFEHIDEYENIGTGPLVILPNPPAVSSAQPPLPTQISPEDPPRAPLPVPLPIIVTDYPSPPSKSHIFPPIATNMVIIQPTKVVNNHVLSTRGLYTDISKVQSVKEHLNVAPIPPPEEIATTVISEPPGPAAEIPVEPNPPPVDTIPPPPVPAPELPIPPPPVEANPPPPVETSEVPVPPPPTEPILAPAIETPEVPPPLQELLPPKPVSIEEEKPLNTPLVPTETPKHEIVVKENAFIKGSKMALQFGTVFLSLMAQFLDSARASIDIMTNPPPRFQN